MNILTHQRLLDEFPLNTPNLNLQNRNYTGITEDAFIGRENFLV